MFTLKLYMEGKTRIVEANGFTVYWYGSSACQITAHERNSDYDDKAFYVGYVDAADKPAPVAAEQWYDRAIIENSNGKTTEIIHPPAPALRNQRAA